MSLRARFLVLLFIALLPFLGVYLHTSISIHSERNDDLRRLAMSETTRFADELERIITGMKQLLVAAANAYDVTSRDCGAYMARLQESFEFISSAGFASPSGEVLCLNEPFPDRLSIADRAHFKRAVESRDFAVGDAAVGRVTGRSFLGFAYPVYDGTTRRLIGVVFASIKLSWLRGEFAKKAMSAEEVIVVTDGTGAVITSAPVATPPGTRLSSRWLTLLNEPRPGFVEENLNPLFSQQPQFVGYSPNAVPPYGLAVFVGLDQREATRAIVSATRSSIVAMSIALIAAVLLYLWFARRAIRVPLHRILEVLNRVQEGMAHTRTGLSKRQGELGQIGVAVDHLLDTLQTQDQQKRSAELDMQRSRDEALRVSAGKTQFLASASHDLRQPLQTLALTAQILAMRHVNDQDSRDIETIKRAVANLGAMVDSLADIAQIDRGLITPRIRPVYLNEVFKAMADEFRLVAQERKMGLVVASSDVWVRSDHTLLGRMIRNLISNALKFTPPGGQVTLMSAVDADSVTIQVKDTGMGIPKDKHEEIFEEFRQLHNPERNRQKGLGLGLAIVRSLSLLLQHPVKVESPPGGGAIFTINVPRSYAPDSDAMIEAAPVREFRGTVLLVEDNREVAEATRRLLICIGAHVRVSYTAEEAFRMLEDGRFDAVVSDYRLPGLSGLAVIERTQQKHAAAIGILMTADSSPELETLTRERHIRLLHKPADPSILLDALTCSLA